MFVFWLDEVLIPAICTWIRVACLNYAHLRDWSIHDGMMAIFPATKKSIFSRFLFSRHSTAMPRLGTDVQMVLAIVVGESLTTQSVMCHRIYSEIDWLRVFRILHESGDYGNGEAYLWILLDIQGCTNGAAGRLCFCLKPACLSAPESERLLSFLRCREVWHDYGRLNVGFRGIQSGFEKLQVQKS